MDDDRLSQYFRQQRSATGLGIFRIVYSLTLLAEVLQLYVFRQLLFDPLPYVEPSAVSLGPAFAVWIAAIVCLVLGLFTRQASIANFVMTLLTFGTSGYWEYHVDYVYTGINLFLVIAPVECALSVDNWLARRSAGRLGTDLPTATVSRVHYDALILVGIAIVYFDSVFYKLASPIWTAGLGVWRPASLPHNTFWEVGWLIDVKPLMLTLGYLTLVFESLFLLLMWFDRMRPMLFVIGVGLHLGIVVMFPIPWFGFAVFALYLLLVPDRWWERVTGLFVDHEQETMSFAAQESTPKGPSPSSGWTYRTDPRAAALVASLAIVVTMLQIVQTSRAPFAKQLARAVGVEPLRLPVEQLAWLTRRPARVLFGVTPHPVFMDFHFDDYEAFYTLVSANPDGTKTWLPMAAESGQGRLGWSGRFWVHWNWRASNPQPDRKMMQKAFRLVTAWWLGRQGRELSDAHFLVMRRPCDPCDGWSNGYYQRQLAHEWEPVGDAEWSGGEFQLRLTPDALKSAASTSSSGVGNSERRFAEVP